MQIHKAHNRTMRIEPLLLHGKKYSPKNYRDEQADCK